MDILLKQQTRKKENKAKRGWLPLFFSVLYQENTRGWMKTKEDKLVKHLKKALENDEVYSDEELFYMKKQLRILESNLKEFKKLTSKGFGK